MEENKINMVFSLSSDKKWEIEDNIFKNKNEITYKDITIQKGGMICRKGAGFDALATILLIYNGLKASYQIWEWIKKTIKENDGINKIIYDNKEFNMKEDKEIEEMKKLIEKELEKWGKK